MSEELPPIGTGDGQRLPYRLLTGTDDRAFCEKVSTALMEGYVLAGSPAISQHKGRTITAQAVILPPESWGRDA